MNMKLGSEALRKLTSVPVYDIYDVLPNHLEESNQKDILSEANPLYGKVKGQICTVKNGKIFFRLELLEEVSASYYFCLYKQEELWEKKPPTKIPETLFDFIGHGMPVEDCVGECTYSVAL